MKKIAIALLLISICISLIVSCDGNKTVEGALEILIEKQEISRGIEPTPMEITSFSITVTDTSSNVVFSKTIKADDGSGSCRLQLPVGNYTVKVSAFNKEDKKIGEGSSAVSVVMGQITQCSVAIHEIEGKGTVSFVFSGEEEDEITVEMFDASMSSISSLQLNYSGATYSGRIELDNGFYFFTVKKADGTVLESDSVRVLANQTVVISTFVPDITVWCLIGRGSGTLHGSNWNERPEVEENFKLARVNPIENIFVIRDVILYEGDQFQIRSKGTWTNSHGVGYLRSYKELAQVDGDIIGEVLVDGERWFYSNGGFGNSPKGWNVNVAKSGVYDIFLETFPGSNDNDEIWLVRTGDAPEIEITNDMYVVGTVFDWAPTTEGHMNTDNLRESFSLTINVTEDDYADWTYDNPIYKSTCAAIKVLNDINGTWYGITNQDPEATSWILTPNGQDNLMLKAGQYNVSYNASSDTATVRPAKTTKIGFVVINDESDLGYTWNFMNGMNAAIEKLKAEGYNIELMTKKNTTESVICMDSNIELAEEGCEIIFNNSYGHEPYMLKAAKEYPNVKFVGMTNCGSQVDDYSNTYNAFPAIYEARYVSGIAAGMKLQQEIEAGIIQPEEAVMGYVGAFSFAEVISAFTSFYLGARSVCPSVTMKVYYVGSWGDSVLEEAATNALITEGCKLISQFSDTTSPAIAAQEAGVYHVGFNTDLTKVAPNASLISSRIDWTRYFYTFIKNHINGIDNPSDWCGTYADGDVEVTKLNTSIAAPGTQEAMDQAIAALASGTLHVFDLSTFTINGVQGTNANMYDSFAAVQGNATYDGYFHESELQSAPYFVGTIDGIEWLNAAY